VVEALAGPARHRRAEMLAVRAPGEQARQHRLRPGFGKNPDKKKKPAEWFFLFFGYFFVFFVFFLFF
jgi:hypothetical protein